MKNSLSLLMLDNACDIYGGPLYGTQYEMSEACKRCGTGARQVGPLVLKSLKASRHEIFYTLNNEVLVSARVADALRAAGMRCLGPVVSSSSHEALPLCQLVYDATLPRFSPESTGVARERPCTECDRDGYFGVAHASMRLSYRTQSQSTEGDMFATFERFGNSRLRVPFKDSVFAPPMYLASARLHKTLSGLRLKGLAFEPVEATVDRR